jgi:hypothetical protein
MATLASLPQAAAVVGFGEVSSAEESAETGYCHRCTVLTIQRSFHGIFQSLHQLFVALGMAFSSPTEFCPYCVELSFYSFVYFHIAT